MATEQKRLFLCVDCGGTKTAAVIADHAGTVVGRGTGGPSNYTDIGMATFLRAVKMAVEAALEAATNTKSSLPSSPSPLTAAWFGISGCDSPATVFALQPELSSLLSLSLDRLVIANDTHLLAAPLSSHPHAKSAVAVIAGTGSNCVSFRRKRGQQGLEELGRSGGWGWMLGDEGSGYFVGRSAVRHIVSQWDQASLYDDQYNASASEVNPATNKPTLRARIFSHFGISSPPDLFGVVYAADPPPLPPPSHSANAPLPSPTPGTIEVPPTPGIVVDASIVDDGVTGTANGPPASPNPFNPNVHLVERKHRLSSLAPLVFSSAFDDADPDALRVLRLAARSLAEHIDRLMVRPGPGPGRSGPKAVRPDETLLCFGGSLVGVAKYRALIVDELGRIRQGLDVGEGEASEMEDEGRGVVQDVVFVGDAAVSGALGIASGFAG